MFASVSVLTFHNINNATDIPFLNDKTFSGILDWIHAINDLSNLGHIQIFHEIIV